MTSAVGSFFLWSLLGTCLAVVKTVNVDDTKGDEMTGAIPIYTPSDGSWTEGQDCQVCFAKPDASLAFDSSWHDATHSEGVIPRPGQKSVSIAFTGELY